MSVSPATLPHMTASADFTAPQRCIDWCRAQNSARMVLDETVTEWRYSTVIARAERPLDFNLTEESTDLRWQPLSQLEELNLMPEFRATLPEVRQRVALLWV